MARRHRESSVLSSIDVTPLVDITFILLITFMVTMPAMENRIKLPEMSDQVAPNPEEEVVIWYTWKASGYREFEKLRLCGNGGYIIRIH